MVKIHFGHGAWTSQDKGDVIDMLQDIGVLEEKYTLDVLMSMGHQLMKEYQLSEYCSDDDYVMESGSNNTNATSLLRRAADFFTRILTQFIGWIRKGQLKEAKKKLLAMKKSRITSNHNKPDGEEEMNTVFWNLNWYQRNVVPVIQDFNTSPLMDMIANGLITNYDRNNVQQHITRAERDQRRLSNLYKRMISPNHRPAPTIFTHKMIDTLIGDTIDFGINDIYKNLVKSKDAIRTIKHAEAHQVKEDDSRRVSQQWTRALTVFGNCCAEVLRILQTIANVLVYGGIKQSNPISRSGQYSGVEKNFTLDKFKKLLRDEIFAKHPQAASHGVTAEFHDEYNEKKKCYIRLEWPGGHSITSCDGINTSLSHFIDSHHIIMSSDV